MGADGGGACSDHRDDGWRAGDWVGAQGACEGAEGRADHCVVVECRVGDVVREERT